MALKLNTTSKEKKGGNSTLVPRTPAKNVSPHKTSYGSNRQYKVLNKK